MIHSGFSRLDELSGLEDRQAYLIHGGPSSGKTSFALTFLAQGLTAGEPVALVTGEKASEVLSTGRHYGMNFSDAVHSGQLLILEYPDDVTSYSTGLLDDHQIIAEFQQMLAGSPIRRLVFDPVTPLLGSHSGPSATARFQTLVGSLGELGATALYLAEDSPQSDWMVRGGQTLGGVIRLSADSAGGRQLTLERWPRGHSGTVLSFALLAGVGMTEVDPNRASGFMALAPLSAAGRALEPMAAPGVELLMIASDAATRAIVTKTLAGAHTLEFASTAAEGVARIAELHPGVVIMDRDIGGVPAAALTRKLRQAGHGMPVMVIGEQLQRSTDQSELLEAGADACLNLPVHARVLRLQIEGLLQRPGRRAGAAVVAMTRQARSTQTTDRISCTTNPEYFATRMEQEQAGASELRTPLFAFTMRSADGPANAEKLSNLAAMASRSSDLVLVGEGGVAILLTEALTPEPFLSRFAQNWDEPATPLIEPISFTSRKQIEGLLSPLVSKNSGIAKRDPAAEGKNSSRDGRESGQRHTTGKKMAGVNGKSNGLHGDLGHLAAGTKT